MAMADGYSATERVSAADVDLPDGPAPAGAPTRQAWLDEPHEPHAEIRQIGRWTYLVVVRHGCMAYGPGGYGWHVWGRGRAGRKAGRVLAAYLRRERWRNTATVVRAEDVDGRV